MSKQPYIMVVDDDPDLVEAVSMKLASYDYRITEAYDGQDAFEKIQQEKPDLLVLDVMMPRKNGYELCNQLKTDPKYKDITVVLLTAVADNVPTSSYTHLDGKSTLADDYIAKPVDLDKLSEIVKDYLS
jgi:CheY-like chemotaxis protein